MNFVPPRPACTWQNAPLVASATKTRTAMTSLGVTLRPRSYDKTGLRPASVLYVWSRFNHRQWRCYLPAVAIWGLETSSSRSLDRPTSHQYYYTVAELVCPASARTTRTTSPVRYWRQAILRGHGGATRRDGPSWLGDDDDAIVVASGEWWHRTEIRTLNKR